MMPGTLFEKFDQLADIPDAVAKIRELVLQLAIQGVLSEQNEKGEHSTDVIAAILSEKKMCKGKFNFPSEQTPIDEDAHSFPIPANWAWCNLSTVALQIQYGYTASADHALTDIRMLRITDIQDNKVDWSSVPGCAITPNEAEKYLLRQNDILIARTGGTIGKSFLVPDAPVKSVFASYLIRVTPPSSIEAKYLKIFLESPYYWMQLRKMSAGTGQPNVNGQALGRLVFPIPPLAEQKRIVAKVAELMVLCDRLEAQQKEREMRHAALTRAAVARFNEAPTPDNLNFLFHKSYTIAPADIRKAILRIAVEGKLIQNYQTRRVTLGDLVELISGQHLLADEQNEDRRGIPYLTGPSDFGTKHPTPSRWTETPKVVAEPGDILITVKGSGVGKTNVLAKERTAISRQLMAVRVTQANPDFVHLVLMNAADHFQSTMTGIAIPGIGRRDVLGLEVELPSLIEQGQVVAKVHQLMTLVDQLETQIENSRTKTLELLDAIIHELLHSKAEAILPLRREQYITTNRSAIGCYAIKYLVQNPNFGRTMLMKMFYLSEAHAGVSQSWQPMRQAAGPYDSAIEDFESLGVHSGWFTVKRKTLNNGHEMIEYQGNSSLAAKVAEASAVLGKKKAEFDRLLGLFQNKTTEEAEIIATLFAAWNDLLIDGKSPSDDEIIREVRENWHSSKERFTPALLTKWLNWMRQQKLVPKGQGPRTIQQLNLVLN